MGEVGFYMMIIRNHLSKINENMFVGKLYYTINYYEFTIPSIIQPTKKKKNYGDDG